MHISFETLNNVYFGSLKTGKFQMVNTKTDDLRDEAVHIKTVSFLGREVAILSKDTWLSEQGLTDELSKANFRYLDYRGLNIQHKWDRLALNYLMTNAMVIPVKGKMYVAKTIGDISYEERRNSFFVDRNPENHQTVHPIFSNNGFNPETLANYGWEHLPAQFETKDKAKSSPFYRAFLKFTEVRNSDDFAATLIDGAMLQKLQKAFNPNQTAEYIHTYLKITNTPEHLLEMLTARDMIVPSFLRSDLFGNLTDCTKYFCHLKDSNSFPDKLEVKTVNPNRIYGLIKKGKEIQDSVIFTQNNKFSSAAAVVKLTGRQTYLLTPEENQSEFDFDTLPVREFLNCYQKTWKNYIVDIFPEELDAHALQTLRVLLTETDKDMKSMSDFINKLSLVITLNKQGADIKELKDRVIELRSLYLELLLLEKHIDYHTVKSIKILKAIDENTTIDKAMLLKTKSSLANLKKEAKVTCAKIGLLPALWEPLLTRVSSRLAKKYSKEHDALRKNKQFELLFEHAHQIRSLITRTKLKSGESSDNIEALDLAKPPQLKPEDNSGMKIE